MNPIAELDRRYVWHPFTQMKDWARREPIVIVEGKGAVLRDDEGREYLDANASIWTNLHGHCHPRLNRALTNQLQRIAHSSALGLASEPASLLAEKLVKAANPSTLRPGHSGNPKLQKVFYSDDGSTAMEVALKLAYEFARRQGRKSPRFLSLGGAYHGDTIGAVSLGHIDRFHKAYAGLLFRTDQTPSPYCYRCPHNRAKPERRDAREYRQCNWECIDTLEAKMAAQKRRGNPYAAFVFEPLMQGAAGMIAQPEGWLKRAAGISREHGAPLIADEVLTGFGRTGVDSIKRGPVNRNLPSQARAVPSLFACHKEGVQPDFMALAKGLTGGYLPMAATLTTQKVFDAFLGEYAEGKTFFHGHSYTGNQLGASVALASIDLLNEFKSIAQRGELERWLREELKSLWTLAHVGDVRQVGLVAGIELVRDWKTREPYRFEEQAGIRVCAAMGRRGVLTRPVGNVLVIMPPYCTTRAQLKKMIQVLHRAIDETLSKDS